MAEYCSDSDIQDRHTSRGYSFVADRDGDGSVSDAEKASYITSSRTWAGSIIDGMICGRYDTGIARSSGNRWLLDRCVDLAAYRSATHGGRKAPKAYKDDYEAAMDMLRAIRDDGQPIPGLTIPTAPNGPLAGSGIPRFINIQY